MDFPSIQLAICRKYKATPMLIAPGSKVGFALNIRTGLQPINGLRLTPTETTCGWYFYAGLEHSEDPDFYVPLHVEHLQEWCPDLLPYLLLPPGTRFIIAPDYEDVWSDPALLNRH